MLTIGCSVYLIMFILSCVLDIIPLKKYKQLLLETYIIKIKRFDLEAAANDDLKKQKTPKEKKKKKKKHKEDIEKTPKTE